MRWIGDEAQRPAWRDLPLGVRLGSLVFLTGIALLSLTVAALAAGWTLGLGAAMAVRIFRALVG